MAGVPDVDARQAVLQLLLLPEWMARHNPPLQLRRKAYVSCLLRNLGAAAALQLHTYPESQQLHASAAPASLDDTTYDLT